MNLNLDGKTALVSAASKGIGKAIAESLVSENCNVAICSSNLENLNSAKSEILNTTGKNVFTLKCDINNKSEIEETVKNVTEEFGGIDILVNNCGGPIPGFFDELSIENWDYAYNQVLMSAVNFINQTLPYMKKNKWGRIINITSLSVKQPVDTLTLSNTFRSGLTALAKTLSNQLGKFSITVNNIAPGYTMTSRLEELAEKESANTGASVEEVFKRMASIVPLQRIGEADEIASLAAFLSSDKAAYITGVTIPVDGGVIKATY